MFSSGLFDLSLHEDLINKADVSSGGVANPRSGSGASFANAVSQSPQGSLSVFKKGKKQEISLNL